MIVNELFRDDRFVILDKPPGLPVHPGPRGGPSVEDCFPHLSRRRTGPWLAHRLDADTSGCLLVALRRAALHEAQACFTNGTVQKTYWAIVQGIPAQPQGLIDAPLLKRTTVKGWRMQIDPAGLAAQTEYRTMGQGLDGDRSLTWLELHPRTGRTHQVRVHCASLGTPILGDPVYGTPTVPLHLLARAIRLPLASPLSATAAPSPHMRDALTTCGWHP